MADSAVWEVEFYADESGREPCRAWIQKLTPYKRLALEEAIRLVLMRRGPDVVQTEFGKALGGGLYEFRLRWSAADVQRKIGGVSTASVVKAEKIMLRVFFCTSGRRIILLLSGYDKAKDPGVRHQSGEIANARRLLTAHAEAERRRKRRRPGTV
jgi:hypothetical protein